MTRPTKRGLEKRLSELESDANPTDPVTRLLKEIRQEGYSVRYGSDELDVDSEPLLEGEDYAIYPDSDS